MRALRPILILALLLVWGCVHVQTRKDMSADELYKVAQAAVKDEEYKDAQKILDRIRDDFPFSKFAVEAELLSADAAFGQKKWEEAAADYRSFEELHPTHPRVDYALYRRGLAETELVRPRDRDQTATRKAADAFQKLIYAHPDSQYVPEARKRLAEARATLAAHELYVAQYYVRKKKYQAALSRLQGLVRQYPDTPFREQAVQLATEIEAKKGGEVRGN